MTTVRAVHCRVAPGAAPVICEPWAARQQPRHGHDAKYSLPYCLALALLGKPVDIAAMTASRMDDDASAMAQRITWAPWADSGFPARFGAQVDLVLADGTVLQEHVEQVAGSAERPPDESQLRTKFLANVSAMVSGDAAKAAWEGILAHAPMVSWTARLRGGGPG